MFKMDITINEKVVSTIEGSYMGYIRIDGEKYYDFRYVKAYKLFIEDSSLGSDFSKRLDLQLLDEGKCDKAQIEKENLENL